MKTHYLKNNCGNTINGNKNLLAQNQSNIFIYQSQLQALMNSKVPVQIEQKPITKIELNLPSDSTAYSQNPYLLYMKQQIEISNKQKKVETAKVLPEFTLGYFNQSLIGYQNTNGTDTYYDASKRFTDFRWEFQFRYGLFHKPLK